MDDNLVNDGFLSNKAAARKVCMALVFMLKSNKKENFPPAFEFTSLQRQFHDLKTESRIAKILAAWHHKEVPF